MPWVAASHYKSFFTRRVYIILSVFIGFKTSSSVSVPWKTSNFNDAASGTNDDDGWWEKFRPKALQNVAAISRIYAPLYRREVEKLLRPLTRSSFEAIPLALLEDMKKAIDMSSAVYSTIVDGHPLSVGLDDKPDCVARYEEETKTLWIISRGTHTASDVLSGATWLEGTDKIGQLDVPSGIVRKCNLIVPNLRDHLDVLRIRKNVVDRICFVGHSLGGAISIALYLTWSLSNLKDNNPRVKTSAITIGAPLLLSNPPNGFQTTTKDLSSKGSMLAENVHNIVTQLDIVPRILGPHPLPDSLLQTRFGGLVKSLLAGDVHRESYRAYGNYYSLREPITDWNEIVDLPLQGTGFRGNRGSSHLIGLVPNPERELLNLFPNSARDIVYSVLRDHSLEESVKAIGIALKDARERGD